MSYSCSLVSLLCSLLRAHTHLHIRVLVCGFYNHTHSHTHSYTLASIHTLSLSVPGVCKRKKGKQRKLEELENFCWSNWRTDGPPGETSQRLLVLGFAELMPGGGRGLQCDGHIQWTNHGWEEEDALALENLWGDKYFLSLLWMSHGIHSNGIRDTSKKDFRGSGQKFISKVIICVSCILDPKLSAVNF